MRLSDAFEKKTDNPELELVCKVYNINFGKNQELLEKCNVLKQYMTFVDYVKYYLSQQDGDNDDDLKKAINLAIDKCIEEGVLVEFLRENRSEVVKVTQMDYTFDRQIMMEREAGREEGRAEGSAAAQCDAIRNIMKSLKLSADEAMDILNIPEADRDKLSSKL